MVESFATWTDAEKDCNYKGGHLASIHSADENSFIHSLYPRNYLWIGGTDAAVEVGFTILVHTL
jgi:neurocan core protein